MRHSGEFGKVRRRDKTSGGHVYINADVLCKAMKNASFDCEIMDLKFKAYPCKDKKRAKIIIQIFKA